MGEVEGPEVAKGEVQAQGAQTAASTDKLPQISKIGKLYLGMAHTKKVCF